MEARAEADAELLRNHQTKTDIRLIETLTILRNVEDHIAGADRAARALWQTIATFEDRENPLLARTLSANGQRQLKVVRENITDLKCQLRVVEKQQKALNERRDLVVRERAALHAPLTLESFRASPIRRMPIDVLVEVFIATQPEAIQPLGRGTVNLLSHVCTEWRAVVSEHAPLWASFSVSVYDADPMVTTWLQIYLQRAKGALLTLEADATPRAAGGVPVMRTLELLAAHSEQFHSLALTGSYCRIVPLSGFRNRLPNLQVLRLPEDANTGLEFQIAPRLHTLVLADSYALGSYPVSQIHSLHLHRGASPSGLAKFTNLRTLTCNLTEIAYQGRWGTAHALLPHLSTWRIAFGGKMSTPPDFFDFYTMPGLQCLEITSLPQPAKLQAFVQRSQCSLRTLVLRLSSVRIAELLAIFELSPGLESFTMEDGFTPAAVPDRLLEALIVAPGRAPLLPKLTHLLIDGTYMFRHAILIKMLESRSEHSPEVCVNLNEVELILEDRVVPAEDVRKLRALEDMDISLDCLDCEGVLISVI
ncbi:hypothetical protein B0H15DRAFT_411392 [Mycena belliarum]|uniref:F-box domain-containing protein n=1 Tax=Mycena belliarum TaxID=1033014 RepID=A0AAD6UFA3_9AGAR|nr:hypothetical protein B0H15DRAFT_411392 [Mycena belliae]